MKTTITKCAGIFILAFLVVAGCSDDDNPVDPMDPDPGPEIPEVYESLPGTIIAENQTWGDTTVAGPHFILPGVTLTIEEGAEVEFEFHNGSAENVGTLVFLPADNENFSEARPSAQINAVGTADNPIVFTSAKDDAQKARNDWGGIILIGDAPNNIPGGTGEVEGLPSAVTYGGDNDSDNSGTIRYVRIEYTGFSIAEGSEIQGLSLYSVGSGTTIEYLNIFECSDDGVELFGGTVDLKYVVVSGADDDSFDYDQGWQGRGQFWLAVQRDNADNGFENDGCDDLTDCSGGNGPTEPTIFNVTVYGPGDGGSPEKNNFGQRLREDLRGSYNNILISNFDGAPFVLEGGDAGEEGDPTYNNYPDQLELNSYIVWNNGAFQDNSAAGGNATEPDATRYATSYNQADPLFTDAAGNVFTLQAGSPARTGATAQPGDNFFDQADYIGAFLDTDWTAGWARIMQ